MCATFVIVCVFVCLFLGTTLYRHFSLLWNPSLEKLIIIINNQVLRKIKIAVKSDVKNWAYISLR